mgnify:CR=1 FL=1
MQTFLQEILKEDVPLGVGASFQQQTKLKKGSVPDGALTQTSFKIVIETKLYKSPDIEQVESYLNGFDKEDKKILLSLRHVEHSDEFRKQVNDRIRGYNSNIIFVSTTFEQIIDSYESILSDQDYEMKDLLEDYRAFCAEERLLPETEFLMRAVACGKTLDENFEFNALCCAGLWKI